MRFFLVVEPGTLKAQDEVAQVDLVTQLACPFDEKDAAKALGAEYAAKESSAF